MPAAPAASLSRIHESPSVTTSSIDPKSARLPRDECLGFTISLSTIDDHVGSGRKSCVTALFSPQKTTTRNPDAGEKKEHTFRNAGVMTRRVSRAIAEPRDFPTLADDAGINRLLKLCSLLWFHFSFRVASTPSLCLS